MKALDLVILSALTLASASRAQETQFFRIAGPVATKITTFSPNGYATWTNAPTNATFTVQAAASLSVPVAWMDYLQVPVTNPVTTLRLSDPNTPSGLAFIPAGSFTMGDNLDGDTNALPLHTVYVSAFYLDKFDVTKLLWDDVYKWATNHGYSFESGAQGKAASHPAQFMTWYDAAKWCNARSEREGRTPAYYTSAAQTTVYRSGTNDLASSFVNWNAGYRLPTEAEWEKAARGGPGGHRFPWTDEDTITQSRANYQAKPLSSGGYAYDVNPTEGFHPTFNDSIFPFTSPVGYFAANGYALYDMAGNVWQWCWDWQGDYSGSSQTDPMGPSVGQSGPYRVVRGGSWFEFAIDARCAQRSRYTPITRNSRIGFRCVLGGASAP